MIRLYLDEDAAQHALVAALRLRGVEAALPQEVGLTAAADKAQLEWCQQEGRVLYTFNVGDFHALHGEFLRLGKDHAGIVLAPQQRYSIGGQMRALVRLVQPNPRGTCETISNSGVLGVSQGWPSFLTRP